MRSACLLVFLLFGACVSPIRTVPAETMLPSDELELPTRYTAGYFLVRAEIDGKGPYWLLLDTGTDRLVVDVSVGEQHADGLFAANMQVRSATGSATPMNSLLSVESLRLGDAEFRDMDAGVLDLTHLSASLEFPVQGLLGCSVFSHCLLTLDYPARRVRVGRGSLGPVDGREVLPLGGNTPWIDGVLADRPMRFLVDTGFGREVAVPPHLTRIPLTGPPRRFGEVITIAGPHPQYLARVDGDLEVGGHRLRRPLATLSPGSPKVGARVLRRFVVVLDLAGRRIQLSRGARRSRSARAFVGLPFRRAYVKPWQPPRAASPSCSSSP